jgi:cytochrome c oxidase assembly factor CtaG
MTEHMVEHAAIASLLAPVLVLLLRGSLPPVRPLVAWPLFVGTLWALNVPDVIDWIMMRPLAHMAADVVVIGVAVLFWAPVLARRRRLRGLGAGAYLITASMATDLIGAWYMAMGETAAGVAMLAGMLPLGVAAVVLTWSGLLHEERRAVRWESYADAAR